MRIARFVLKSDAHRQPRLGVVDGEGVRDVTDVTQAMPPLRWPLSPGDALIAHLDVLRPQMQAMAARQPLVARDDVHFLSPVANPGKLVCGVGNWSHHQAPLGMLGFLVKATSSLAGEAEGVQLRWPDRTTVHEPELAIVIGRTCVNVTPEEALSHVAGYTCGLDMTLKEEREFFCFCKSFDTYGVLGPHLVTADEIDDPSALSYQFRVNGELRGERSFRDLTGSPAQLVAFASSAMTLHPGDVILCGAADVAPVAAGDVMHFEIAQIGRLQVGVSVSPHARGRPSA
ncbi:MAG TPA: fumarylacetoacetate hydrolase family protein [Nevskiaceae bacterium]|nr:fumarylacetoacetate hydrolase family protein [Nevskiaceae bacterium]